VVGGQEHVGLRLVERLAVDARPDVEVVDQRNLAAALFERAFELG
jgi:hypothetical protein